MPQTVPPIPVFLPARAREVAAHDGFDRQHLCASADHHPPAQIVERPEVGRSNARSPGIGEEALDEPVRIGRDEVVRDDRRGLGEPEARQPGEHPALVGDRRGQDDVERADPIGGDEQQPTVVERVQVADLAGADERSAVSIRP